MPRRRRRGDHRHHHHKKHTWWDTDHYRKPRERRKYAQAYLTRDDIRAVLVYLAETPQEQWDVAPARYDEKQKKRVDGYLLWRKRLKFSLHPFRQAEFYRNGELVRDPGLSELERDEVIKHKLNKTRPAPTAPEYRFWENKGEWKIKIGELDLKVTLRGDEYKITDDEKRIILHHLDKMTRPKKDEAGYKFFKMERTFKEIRPSDDGSAIEVRDKSISHEESKQWRTVVATEDVESVLTNAFRYVRQRTGPDRLYRRLCEKYVGISRESVRQFLKKQVTYQLHQPLRDTHTVHEIIMVNKPYERWQADLIDA